VLQVLTEDPPALTHLPPPAVPERVHEDPEALIVEARRRQRRRRIATTIFVAATVSGITAVYFSLANTGSRTVNSGAPGPALHTPALLLHLRGFGTPLATQIDRGPCPQGRTLIHVRSPTQTRGGSVAGCVLTIRKWDQPNYGVKRIVQTVRETYHLARGSIVTRETQTINFARDQRHTTALFQGRIVGGSGRYASVSGTVLGGGQGVDGTADWLVSLHVH
jgi:hypothetical protein